MYKRQLGTQTSSDSIKTTFKDRKTFSYAILFQIIALPFLGLVLSQIFSNNIFSLSIAVVLLAPGGFISGILTHFKKGNIPLSVTLTSITSIVSPLTTVAWLSLISVNVEEFDFNLVQTFTQLVLLIFIPYSIGLFVKFREFRLVNKLTNFLDKFIKLYILVVTFTGPFELRDPLINYFSESILVVISSIISIYFIQQLSSKLVNIPSYGMGSVRELSLIVTESFSGITSTVVVVVGIVVVVLVVVVSIEAEILTSVELLTIYTYDVPRNKTIKNIMNEIIFDLLFI